MRLHICPLGQFPALISRPGDNVLGWAEDNIRIGYAFALHEHTFQAINTSGELQVSRCVPSSGTMEADNYGGVQESQSLMFGENAVIAKPHPIGEMNYVKISLLQPAISPIGYACIFSSEDPRLSFFL